MRPYIGITDFTSSGQVIEMRDAFLGSLPSGSSRTLHVGVMMSYKTLHGIPSMWADVFPRKKDIASIFSEYGVYNCLHYADYANNPKLGKSLELAIAHGGSGIHAIQLDMTWPDPVEIAYALRACGKDIEVILQIGKVAFEQVNHDVGLLLEKLASYSGVIHRVLLDKSMGRGVGMDAHGLIPFARAISQRFPEIGIVAAGGLGPESLHLVAPLIAEFPNLSIDAQGKLRPSGSALDPIDWNMARNYLVHAQQLFS